MRDVWTGIKILVVMGSLAAGLFFIMLAGLDIYRTLVREHISTPAPSLDDLVVALHTITSEGDALVGSGVIVDRNGGILMAAHMTSSFPKGTVVVITKAGERYIGKIMWSSTQTDLAYIQVDAVTFPYEATIASGYKTGDAIEIVGHPRGVLWIHTRGYIAGDPKPDISPMDVSPSYWVIPMDTTTAPGNSGGGVFNEAGELVAIVSWAFRGPTEATGSLSFATPSDVICRLLLCGDAD